MYRRVSMSVSKVYLRNLARRREGSGGGGDQKQKNGKGKNGKKLFNNRLDDDRAVTAPATAMKKEDEASAKIDELCPTSPRGDQAYTYEDQLRFLISSTPHQVVEVEVRPEDDLLNGQNQNY